GHRLARLELAPVAGLDLTPVKFLSIDGIARLLQCGRASRTPLKSGCPLGGYMRASAVHVIQVGLLATVFLGTVSCTPEGATTANATLPNGTRLSAELGIS